MRVAIAGSGGLACAIAHYLATETYHSFIILSRAVMRPHGVIHLSVLTYASPSRIFRQEGGK